jgi:hypothetical protein
VRRPRRHSLRAKMRPVEDEAGGPPGAGKAGTARRLAWFVALYLASAGAFALFVYGLRAIVPR